MAASAAAAVILVLAACGLSAAAPAGPDPFETWWAGGVPGRALSSIAFEDVGVPHGAALSQARMSREVRILDEVVAEGSAALEENFHLIVKVGEAWRAAHPYDGDTFGLLRTARGDPIYEYDSTTGVPTSSGFYSKNPDFASMIRKDGRTVMVVHMEDYPGGTYLLDLDHDLTTGALQLNRSTFMNWSAYGGMWNPCAGTLSPWNTHLGAEEYGPDIKGFSGLTGFPHAAMRSWEPARMWANVMRYHGVYPVGSWSTYKAEMARKMHPYMFGYVFEAGFEDGDGKAFAKKRMAMGRKSGELAFVMPDRRTVYMTDDGDNTVLSVFLADEVADLSSGRLYCARAEQTSAEGGGSFNLTWIDMGHAKEADVAAVVFGWPSAAMGPTFSDLFEEASPEVHNRRHVCPQGFGSVHGGEGFECLRVRAGKEVLASRLETRRYASLLGCTTEWSKMEGFAYSADTGRSYIAMSNVYRGMEDRMVGGRRSDHYDAGTGNHVHVPYNPCGCIYELSMGPQYMATSMRGLLCGTTQGGDAENECNVRGIANPDNLVAVQGHGALLIGEDTSMHRSNVLWKYDLETGTLQERVASTPLRAEVSSPYFYPDVGGWSYVIMVAQHPDAPGYRESGLGYTSWQRHCGVTYPAWSAPGEGADRRCGRSLGAVADDLPISGARAWPNFI